MDDVTNERFRRIEDRIGAVERGLGDLGSRVDAGFATMTTTFNGALDAASKGIIGAIEQHVDRRFNETMRKFQEAADQRARIEELEERLAKVEALLAAGGTRQ
jgi:hypothetical protein